jgi:hypothetical protein
MQAIELTDLEKDCLKVYRTFHSMAVDLYSFKKDIEEAEKISNEMRTFLDEFERVEVGV